MIRWLTQLQWGIALFGLGLIGMVVSALSFADTPKDTLGGPTLIYGQEVFLNNGFYHKTRAIVQSPSIYGKPFYMVVLKDGPGGRVEINSRITLPVPVTDVIFTEGQERKNNE